MVDANELIGLPAEGAAEWPFLGLLRVGIDKFGVVDVAVPEFGFGPQVAAAEPVAVDEGFDEVALFGGGGLAGIEVFGGEEVEVGLLLVFEDEGFGVEAVL